MCDDERPSHLSFIPAASWGIELHRRITQKVLWLMYINHFSWQLIRLWVVYCHRFSSVAMQSDLFWCLCVVYEHSSYFEHCTRDRVTVSEIEYCVFCLTCLMYLWAIRLKSAVLQVKPSSDKRMKISYILCTGMEEQWNVFRRLPIYFIMRLKE